MSGKIIPNRKRWKRPAVRLRDGVLSGWISENSSLSRLAKDVGVARWTIMRYLNGSRHPDPERQRGLVEATKLPFWTLFEEIPPSSPQM